MDAIVVISDTHIGSNVGLCQSPGIRLDEGGISAQNVFQETLWRFWQHYWNTWIPEITKGVKSRTLVHNGDIIEGSHHHQTDNVPNIDNQEVAAVEILKPVVKEFDRFYSIRGTEAHGDVADQSTERIAKELSAVKEQDTGRYSRQELWLDCNGVINQFAHHLGMTTSAAYETSAPMRELISTLIEAAQWNRPLPHIVWRSHRHRYTRVPVPTEVADIELVVTPCWQLKTAYIYKIDRTRMPHIGGVVALIEKDKSWQIKRKLYPLPQPIIEKI